MTAADGEVPVGTVRELWRYPVKSMLGERLDSADVDDGGLSGDRRFAVVDRETGRVGSAKQPSRWRRLLQVRAEAGGPGGVRLRLPDGRAVSSDDPAVDGILSEFLGRPVTLAGRAEPGASLERSIPDAVLAAGVDAVVDFTVLELAAVAPPGTFFDFSPLQVVTTAALAEVGRRHPAGAVDQARYRPNVVIDTGAATGFVENDWVDRLVRLGPEVSARIVVPTPRCAIPTLAHGDRPVDPDALRVVARLNIVDIPLEGLGPVPCLGAYAVIVTGGRLAVGDDVRLEP